MSKFLLALDQSTAITGYAVFKGQELITYGHIHPEGEYMLRISKLRDWLENIIDTLNGDVEVIIEDIQLQEYEPNGKKIKAKDFGVVTYKKLAHLQGVLKNYCYESGVPYRVVSPSTWRTYSDIKGKKRQDKKKNAQLKVKKLYDI